MKGADRYMKIILIAFPKKIMFGANGPFKTQKDVSSQLWIHCKDCVAVLHSERGKERHGNYINGFSEEKKLIWGNFVILAQKWCIITLDLLQVFF